MLNYLKVLQCIKIILKHFLSGDAKKDIKSVLIEAGATSANVYTLNIKNENEMNYAVYGNIVLGKQLSGRMSETKHVNADPSSLGALASAINKGIVQFLVLSQL